MATTPQDNESPHSRWGSDFWDKYQQLSSLIASRPDGYPPRQLIPEPQASPHIQNTEKLLTHVTGLVNAKSDQIGERWQKGVATIQLPGENGDPSTHEVSLDNIANWTPQYTTITRSKPGRGAGTETIPVRGYLPPTAATQLFRQFQTVLDHLGWAEDATIKDYTAGGDEVLRHE